MQAFMVCRKGAVVLTHIKGNYQLRPDSPKTREACLALGYDSS